MKAFYKKYILEFKRPSGTSRGTLKTKETWFLILRKNGKYGIGECGVFRGLSVDDVPEYEERLKWVCANIRLGKHELWKELIDFPSIQFGVEQAFLSLASNNPYILFPSNLTDHKNGIPINGLIWMGEAAFMREQIRQKLKDGFRCIKMKIGALDFAQELSLLASIRSRYASSEIEIRVDANGAFHQKDAYEKLRQLAAFGIHSIEQPIRQGNVSKMSELCAKTPLPIALDEELIGIKTIEKKEELLQNVRPQYIILKPSLIGGFRGSNEWINLAEKYNIGWWVTSALESNIGLNAIAQWTYTLNSSLPQGLGTGSLFTNNFKSPLVVDKGVLYYSSNQEWETDLIHNLCI